MPEVVEDFFTTAGPGGRRASRSDSRQGHVYRIGKVPQTLTAIGGAT